MQVNAGAKNNSASIDEYREKHCSLKEDDAAAIVTKSFRQRRVNPAAVAAWSACRAETEVLLDPKLDANQKVASFSITYDSRRLPGVPTLRGINAPTFLCTKAGSGEEIGVGGDAIELSAHGGSRCSMRSGVRDHRNRKSSGYSVPRRVFNIGS